MTEPRALFVRELARASRKANRYLRHLQRSDREEVLAMALVWCWENRDNYSLTTTLDTWFVDAVKNAHRTWQRAENKEHVELAEPVPGDTTLGSAEALSSAKALVAALPPEYRRVLWLDAHGYTREEIRARGISDHCVTDTRARVAQLRKLVPDTQDYERALRTYDPEQGSHEERAFDRHMAPIDKELAKLDFPPQHGKDCPPCWKCKWFEGLLPGINKQVAMKAVHPEIAEAVHNTEQAKIRIANEVRGE